MCNAYRLKPKRNAKASEAALSEEITKLPTPLVRRSGRGVVALWDSGDLTHTTMRWGFARHFSDSINNTRSDKLNSPMWKEALRSCRCLVPITEFYEWQHMPSGKSQPYRFFRDDGDWMWIAGLYEHSNEHGACYSTITTEPPAWMKRIHDRMIAVLDYYQAIEFLHGKIPKFTPYSGRLIAEPCVSPLKKPQSQIQGELF